MIDARGRSCGQLSGEHGIRKRGLAGPTTHALPLRSPTIIAGTTNPARARVHAVAGRGYSRAWRTFPEPPRPCLPAFAPREAEDMASARGAICGLMIIGFGK
jgi:hypothetical protein